METVKVNTSQHVEIDYPVAGVMERIAAYLIDFALFFSVYLIVILTFGLSGLAKSFENTFVVVLIALYAICYVFYDFICEVLLNGQSIGKKLLKIKVISLDGAQPSIGQYFIRWIFRIVDFTLSANTLGFICVLVSEKKQRIGDIVAGTTVIKTVAATKLGHIAFHSVADEGYIPTFGNVGLLSDRDVELIHEVVSTYYTTQNPQLIYKMADKVCQYLSIVIPAEMNEMQFLKVISSDYIQLTSRSV